MSKNAAPDDDFAFEVTELGESEGAQRLVLDLDGFEGPLDLLLDLARREKLDLRAIPIVPLADQYLAFIREAQRLKLEVAGDYLVMAAWLTYLKSRLLLPKRPNADEPAADALVQDLAERLKRLDTFRKAGEVLGARLNEMRECFPRGQAEGVIVDRRLAWAVSLNELVTAYAERRIHVVRSHYTVKHRKTLSIPEAREILERLVGKAAEWCPLDVLIAAIQPGQAERRSAKASSFVAALELVRDGSLDLKQEEAFAPIFLRRSLRAAPA